MRGILINKAPCYEDIQGSGGIDPRFLTSTLDGGTWSTSHPVLFISGIKAPNSHCIGGLVLLRAGLDTVEKNKPALAGNPTLASRPPSLWRSLCTGWAILAPQRVCCRNGFWLYRIHCRITCVTAYSENKFSESYRLLHIETWPDAWCYLLSSNICHGYPSLTRRPPFTRKKIPGTHFVRAWVDPRGIVRLEGVGQLKKSNDLIGNRTHDFPACSIVPQPTTLLRAPPPTSTYYLS
jgi:hypothetical protein